MEPTTLHRAQRTLYDLQIFSLLQEYHPHWVGRIPLNLHNPGNKIIILGDTRDLPKTEIRLKNLFGHLKYFLQHQYLYRGEHSLITGFDYNDFQIEIVFQSIPVLQQYAYRYYLVEKLEGERQGTDLRGVIRQLQLDEKDPGEAFARWLELNAQEVYPALVKWCRSHLNSFPC